MKRTSHVHAIRVSFVDLFNKRPATPELLEIEAPDLLRDLATCMKPKVADYLHDVSGFRVDDDHLEFTPATIRALRGVAYTVGVEYDANGTGPTWERFELSGDDDVDYNGSFLEMLADALEGYIGQSSRLSATELDSEEGA